MMQCGLRNKYSFLSILVEGQIRTTVGQGHLLMRQRFKQFSGLVDDCEFNTGERETTFTDLQGFWDMIYFQVGHYFIPRMSVFGDG